MGTVGDHLGDALWQVAGRRDDAVARYRRAILLAETELEARPADATLLAQLGYYYGRVGDPDQANRHLSEALAVGPEMLYVQYFVGVSAADRSDRETALRAVAALVRLGYPPTLLRSAPEFRSLLQDAEYKKIIELGPLDVFGEICFLGVETRSASIVSLISPVGR